MNRTPFSFCAFLCLFVAVLSSALANDIQTLRLTPPPNMDRAELHHVKTVSNPRAVLVLCPGYNGSGEGLIRSKVWQDFAKKERLGLVGLSFASPINTLHDGTGYYYTNHGSGEILLEGLRKIFGKDLPILLYGFSGGAHFTSRFTEWKPERVLTWCAYSAGWWDVPEVSDVAPPGIVACGDADNRYGASLVYFKQGRAAGKPWLWISLGGVGHVGSRELDDFVRIYFSAILQLRSKVGLWVDVYDKNVISQPDAEAQPALSGWLPSNTLYENWKQVHTP